MSTLFHRPKGPKIIAAPEPVEEVEMIVEEDAEEARKKEKKKLRTGGRGATVMAGIVSALKKRLGE